MKTAAASPPSSFKELISVDMLNVRVGRNRFLLSYTRDDSKVIYKHIYNGAWLTLRETKILSINYYATKKQGKERQEGR